MKNILYYSLIISAVHWLVPAQNFNIVEANEEHDKMSQSSISEGESRGGMESDQGKQASEKWKPEYMAHTYMTRTYLDAASRFLDGLEQQSNADVSLSSEQIQKHLKHYGDESLKNLKSARVHLIELSGTLSRSPASEKSKSTDHFSKTKQNLDQAINLNSKLNSTLNSGSKSWNREQLKSQVSQLQEQLKSASESHSELISSLGV
ncbi:MAG: hypothetical protein AB1540_01310 [Bdellovibrionota bacterium]